MVAVDAAEALDVVRGADAAEAEDATEELSSNSSSYSSECAAAPPPGAVAELELCAVAVPFVPGSHAAAES